MFDFLTNPDFISVVVVWIGALCTLGHLHDFVQGKQGVPVL